MSAAVRLPLEMGLVHPLTADEAMAEIARRGDGPRVLANLNLHGLYLYQTDPTFRRFCDEAETVLIDGWPVLALAMLGGATGLTARNRIGSTDWLFPLIERDEPLVVVAVGGSPESAALASEAVRSRTSRMTWHAFDGFGGDYRSDGPELSLDEALSVADLVIVGMGMPRQEAWIMQHRAAARDAVFANVGGCIDYLAGVQQLAPRWLGGLGLEWLYRLARSPRRLADRYLLEPMRLVVAVADNRSRARRALPTRSAPENERSQLALD